MSRIIQRIPRSFAAPSGGGVSAPFLGAALVGTPFFRQWNFSTGYSTVPDPATLPTGIGYAVDYSLDGLYVAVAHDFQSSVSLTIYNPNDLSAPPVQINTGGDCQIARFSPDGLYLATYSRITNELTVYNVGTWTIAASKSITGATSQFNDSEAMAWTPNSSEVWICVRSAPFLSIFPVATWIEDTSFSPGLRPDAIAFSPDGKLISLAFSASPFVSFYSRTNSNGIIPGAPDIHTNGQNSCGFSPDSLRYLGHANNRAELYDVVESGLSTTVTEEPTNLFKSASANSRYKLDGTVFVVVGTGSPFVYIFDSTSPYAEPVVIPDTQSANSSGWGPE